MPRKSKHGRVAYGGRAFHQDATAAMRGDIVRGLIELITNSDDSYVDGKGKLRVKGKIRVEVKHCHGPWYVIVRDRARGMRRDRMEQAITQLGGRTSRFETGERVRGNLGRGAKDLAAFGTVDFESICEEKYSTLTLQPNGEFDLFDEVKVTPEHRKLLRISRGNGTVVTIHVTDNIRCPRHRRLVERLNKHFHLRDILSDPNREVQLVDPQKDDNVILRYQYPAAEPVFDDVVEIGDYLGATAHVVICRNSERFDEPASDPGRPGGLLIKGRRAIYGNTLLRFEHNPHAGWFSGFVVCEYIDKLAMEYDERLVTGDLQEDRNPTPVITRRRDGLHHAHPFYKCLAEAVEGPWERWSPRRRRRRGIKLQAEMRECDGHWMHSVATSHA